MPGVPLELAALAARVMRPERAALADAGAAIAVLVDPREAWLALAHRGLIPSDWIFAPSRRFAVRSRSSSRGCALSGTRPFVFVGWVNKLGRSVREKEIEGP